ncbi:hypothetical protein UG55_10984 [Frankia sp. EI5c]|uniref:hypothetical protein n=1 Tax=Frankia sp. EI5c TaxID=683316 RepID=UPI0007C3BDFF|nr:hypothetical protein [Frankia sp. EI5c]OAA18851.1 hypothetical protein UG55_10984 [Frankia sp. EI5c]
MTEYLRLDPASMRLVAQDLDTATEVARRMSATIPTLADGYDLPPALARQVRAELGRIGAALARAAGTVQGLGRDVRARAVLAELADAAGRPGQLPGGLAVRLRQVVENFECPLDDPVRNLLHESAAAAAGGAQVGAGRLREALTDITDGAIANSLRQQANQDLGQCQPPVELPDLPPPPPPPPPAPGFFERAANAVADAADSVTDAVEGALEDLPSPDDRPAGDGPFPIPVPVPLPVPVP